MGKNPDSLTKLVAIFGIFPAYALAFPVKQYILRLYPLFDTDMLKDSLFVMVFLALYTLIILIVSLITVMIRSGKQ